MQICHIDLSLASVLHRKWLSTGHFVARLPQPWTRFAEEQACETIIRIHTFQSLMRQLCQNLPCVSACTYAASSRTSRLFCFR